MRGGWKSWVDKFFQSRASDSITGIYAGIYPSLRVSVCLSVCLSVRPLQLRNRDLDCSHSHRRTKLAGHLCLDMLFHIRFIPTPRNVLDPPFLGFTPPPLSVSFRFIIKLQHTHKNTSKQQFLILKSRYLALSSSGQYLFK